LGSVSRSVLYPDQAVEGVDDVSETPDALISGSQRSRRRREKLAPRQIMCASLALTSEAPTGAAERDAERLESEIAHLRAIVERIENGYHHFDRFCCTGSD
jgi:hypothetical protein